MVSCTSHEWDREGTTEWVTDDIELLTRRIAAWTRMDASSPSQCRLGASRNRTRTASIAPPTVTVTAVVES